MLSVVSVAITDWMGLTGNTKVLVGSLAAVSGDRLVRLVRTAFLRRTEAELEMLGEVAKVNDIMRVPAGAGVLDEIGAHSGTADDPAARAGAALQGAFRQSTVSRPPIDQIDLLRKLDQAE